MPNVASNERLPEEKGRIAGRIEAVILVLQKPRSPIPDWLLSRLIDELVDGDGLRNHELPGVARVSMEWHIQHRDRQAIDRNRPRVTSIERLAFEEGWMEGWMEVRLYETSANWLSGFRQGMIDAVLLVVGIRLGLHPEWFPIRLNDLSPPELGLLLWYSIDCGAWDQMARWLKAGTEMCV